MSARVSGVQRLLVVTNMWPSEANRVFGGFVARSVDALRAEGAEVDVVANVDSRTGVVPSVLKYARLALRVRRHARGRTYDAVIGHYLYPTAAMAHTASRITGAPLVLVVHGTDSKSVRRKDPWAWAARRALSSADLVITASSALARVVREDLALPAEIPVAAVHVGIDDEVFRPDLSARETLGIPAEERVVLYVGNLMRPKGLDVLQQAFARSGADRLVLVGAGPMEAELRTWASEVSGDTRRVMLTGRISQAEVARWMSAADVLVLPSRSEGLGLVLLEAMTCGTPCVASRVGGIPEIVDERTGALVEPGDAEALADAIAHVLDVGRSSYTDACLQAARGHGVRPKARELLATIDRISPPARELSAQ